MTSKEIIRTALTKAGITQTQLSDKLEYSNRTAVGAILNKNSSLRSDIFCKWLDALGFEIVIRPKNKKDNTEWIMTEESESDEIAKAAIEKAKSENSTAMRDSLK